MDGLADVRPGDILAGKYRIERVLGQGGMGVVVAAHHLQLDERVAIKFLLPEALQSAEAVARFAREARAAVKIKSEHVARVIDVGTLETGSPYMVMEYLHGQDLGSLVQQRGAIGFEEAVDYVLQACEAIAEAHALGIVHRDLKPQNLFLSHRADGSPCVKVLDFGISKVTSVTGSDMSMTKTSAVMGSPLYMSPEQMASSRDVDGRTDIWALGVIVHELLTGRVPFLADTVPQICAMILQSQAPPLRNFRPDAPEGLQNVVLRCLEKDPARRFRNVAEFAAALLPFAPRGGRLSVERISRVLSAAGLSQGTVDIPPSSYGAPASVTQAAWGQTVSSGRRIPWVLVGGAAAAAIAATAVFFLRTPDEPTARVAPSADNSVALAAAAVAPALPLTEAAAKPAASSGAPAATQLASAPPPASPVPSASEAVPAPRAVPPTKPPAQRSDAVTAHKPAAPIKPAAPAKPAALQRPTSELYNDRK